MRLSMILNQTFQDFWRNNILLTKSRIIEYKYQLIPKWSGNLEETKTRQVTENGLIVYRKTVSKVIYYKYLKRSREEHKMKRKSRMLLLLFTMMLICSMPVSANAMSATNKKAHKAFTSQLKKDKKQFCSFSKSKLKYVYADIDGDKVDELITEPGYGYCSQIIYDYQNGKVKSVAVCSQGTFTTYYPKHKAIFIKKSGHMGYLSDFYLKFNGKSYKWVATASYEYKTYDYSKRPSKTTYAVKSKAVSKKQYIAYTKKVVKGEKGKSFKSLKWKKY